MRQPPGFCFRFGEGFILLRIPPLPPARTGLHQFVIQVFPCWKYDIPDHSSVASLAMRFDENYSAIGQSVSQPPGFLPVPLALLKAVYPEEA